MPDFDETHDEEDELTAADHEEMEFWATGPEGR